MHSLCEYVKVQQQEQRLTKILRLQNLRFFQEWMAHQHDDSTLKSLNASALLLECKRGRKRTIQRPKWHRVTSHCVPSEPPQRSFAGSDLTLEPTMTLQFPPSGNTIASSTSPQSRYQTRFEMLSQQLERTSSTLQNTRLAHTPSAREQPWRCSSGDACSSS